MQRIEPWRDEARDLSRGAFRARHDLPCLVLRWVAEGELGRGATPQATHLHTVPPSLAERIAAGSAVPDRRPVDRERIAILRRDPHRNAEIYTIGRDRGCEVFVNDYTVSSRHAQLQWMERIGRWMLRDVESTNGTWLNGQRLPPHERALLASTDVVQLGRMCFLFLVADDLHSYLTGDF